MNGHFSYTNETLFLTVNYSILVVEIKFYRVAVFWHAAYVGIGTYQHKVGYIFSNRPVCICQTMTGTQHVGRVIAEAKVYNAAKLKRENAEVSCRNPRVSCTLYFTHYTKGCHVEIKYRPEGGKQSGSLGKNEIETSTLCTVHGIRFVI